MLMETLVGTIPNAGPGRDATPVPTSLIRGRDSSFDHPYAVVTRFLYDQDSLIRKYFALISCLS